MSSVAVGRLRSIAKTVRQLPTFYQMRGSIADHYFLIVDKGAAFIREAESLGALQGDSIYGRVGEKLAHPSCHLDDMVPIAARKVPGWKLTVWYAVVDTLAPELIGIRSQSIVTDANGNYSMRFDTSEEEAEIVARAIEAEANRLEAQLKERKRTEPHHVPEPPRERRDKWIYHECMKSTPYQTIAIRLKKKPKNWPRIGSVNGIKRAAERYAERHSLPKPPARQAGRPPG